MKRTNYAYLVLLLSALPFLSFCIGKADDVRTRKQSADELPAYLVQAVGTLKINQLLHNPLDVSAPGLFIDDMLYLIGRSDVKKLIAFVRDVEAARILRLTYNIKRMGCNKVNPTLNILLPSSYVNCTLDTFNHLDVLVRMINGTNDIQQLVQIVNQVSFGAQLGTRDAYLEKLAYLIVYIGGVDKVFQLLNGIVDTRDIIFFVDRLDASLNVAGATPATIAEIQSGAKLGNMDSVLRILVKLNDGNKIFELINGVRPLGGDSTQQQNYLINLTTVMQSIDTEAGQSCPNDTGITTLAALINNLTNALSLVNLIEQLNPANVAALVNRVAKTSQHTIAIAEPSPLPAVAGSPECLVRTDLEAGGKKLAFIMNQVAQVEDLIFVINNLDPNPVNGVRALGDIIGRLNVADAYKLGQLLNDVTPVGPAAQRYNYVSTVDLRKDSTGVGKVVNLLNGLDSGGSLVKLLNNITDPAKLPALLNGTSNSSNLVGFLNAILRTPAASFNDLVDFINTVTITTGVPRLIQLVENLTAATETPTVINPSAVHMDIAALMAPYNSADIAVSGIGTPAMATLLNTLDSTAAVARLIDILNATGIYAGASAVHNGNFTYNNATPNIPRRQGLVRIIIFGVRYLPLGYDFPALGPERMAQIINLSASATNLIALLNASAPLPFTNITDAVVLLACGDRLATHETACNAINMGW